MDAEDVGAALQRFEMELLGGFSGGVGGEAQGHPDHAFAGDADEDGMARILQFFEGVEHSEVLFHGFAEAESRIEDPVFNALIFSL